MYRIVTSAALGLAALGGFAWLAHAQAPTPHVHGPAPAAAPSPAAADGAPTTFRVQMQELHDAGGVPRGWKFALPPGDAGRGRTVFGDLECFRCHAVRGESFPAPSGETGKGTGPDLTGMGAHHPAEYFAESILLPNRVILQGPGYTGPDGLSIMPSYADSLSVTQLADLVAFLKAQTDGGGNGGAHAVERQAVKGDYSIRLVFAAAGAAGHAHPGAPMAGSQSGAGSGHVHGAGSAPAHVHGAAPSSAPAATGRGHLMAFIADRELGEFVPYLPVTVTVQPATGATQTIKLLPMSGGRGFHYGADVTLPARTQKLTLNIGAAAMTVMGPARYKTPVKAPFDWEGVGP